MKSFEWNYFPNDVNIKNECKQPASTSPLGGLRGFFCLHFHSSPVLSPETQCELKLVTLFAKNLTFLLKKRTFYSIFNEIHNSSDIIKKYWKFGDPKNPWRDLNLTFENIFAAGVTSPRATMIIKNQNPFSMEKSEV
jgi:hypothetical protein